MATSCTDLTPKSFMYSWIVPHFDKLNLEEYDFIMSPLFTDSSRRTKWFAELFPDGMNSASKGYFSLFLRLQGPGWVKAKISVSLEDASGNLFFHYNWLPYRFDLEVNNGYGDSRIVSRERVFQHADSLLPGGELSILFHIEILDMEGRMIPELVPSKLHVLEKMRTNVPFDLVIKAGEVEVKMHKAVLLAVSPQLAKRIEKVANNDSSDSSLDRVLVNDLEPSALSPLVDYFYSQGQLDASISIELCRELYIAGIMYEIDSLPEACEYHLALNLNPSTAIDILRAVEQHPKSKLYAMTIDFIHNNAAEVITTESWVTAIDKEPDVLKKALRDIAKTYEIDRKSPLK